MTRIGLNALVTIRQMNSSVVTSAVVSSSDTSVVAPEIAKLQGIALASVFQIIISEAGWRTVEGQSQAKIADELYPIVENVLDELDRWLNVSGPPAPRRH
jgi:hypothetical protein